MRLFSGAGAVSLRARSERPASRTHRHLLLAAIIAAPCVPASAAVVPLINDTQMPLADWSAVAINTSGGFTFGVSNPAAGGNGGAYRGISQASTAGFAQGTVIHTHAVGWDPSTQGAIDALDMGIDVNCFDGGTSGAVGFGLVVVQAGSVYFGPTFTALTNSGWRTDLHAAGLTQASFHNSLAATPDFSAAGGPIAFGFFSSNGTGNGVPINSSSGADNFVVTLSVVPAPGAAGTLLAAGLLAARRRR